MYDKPFVVETGSLLFRLTDTFNNHGKWLNYIEMGELLNFLKKQGVKTNELNNEGNTVIMEFLATARDFQEETNNEFFSLSKFIGIFESSGFLLTDLGKNNKNIWHALFKRLNAQTIDRVFDHLITKPGVQKLLNYPDNNGIKPTDVLKEYTQSHPLSEKAVDVLNKCDAIILKNRLSDTINAQQSSQRSKIKRKL